MTTRRNTKNLLATSTVAIVLAGALTACSGGGGSIEAFCEDASALEDGSAFDALSGTDPEAGKAAFAELVDQVKDIDAPDEIEDDWSTFVSGIESLNDALQDADLEDPEAMANAFEEIDSEGIQTASDNIGTFTQENCEA